jgi:hypothetical protein
VRDSLQQLPGIFGRGMAGAFHQRWPGIAVTLSSSRSSLPRKRGVFMMRL